MVEQAFNFIPSFVEFLVICPRDFCVGFGRDNRDTLFLPDGFSGLVVSVAFVHNDRCFGTEMNGLQEFSSSRRIVVLARAQRKSEGSMGRSSQKVNFGR